MGEYRKGFTVKRNKKGTYVDIGIDQLAFCKEQLTVRKIFSFRIEKLSKKECKKHSLFGYPKGSVFITAAPELDAIGIIHAVTMRTPGSKASFRTIKKLVPNIINAAEYFHFKTVAVPLLGTGTGGLPHKLVYDYLTACLADSQVNFWIYTNHYDTTHDKIIKGM